MFTERQKQTGVGDMVYLTVSQLLQDDVTYSGNFHTRSLFVRAKIVENFLRNINRIPCSGSLMIISLCVCDVCWRSKLVCRHLVMYKTPKDHSYRKGDRTGIPNRSSFRISGSLLQLKSHFRHLKPKEIAEKINTGELRNYRNNLR